ncbi:TPA: hypothetical protein HA251_00945 [Candidatus Woesearchaeota archaeon]|nr:hypothetical protein [Candidatus Woesearchaeota archaeon]
MTQTSNAIEHENHGIRQRAHDGVDRVMDKADSMRDAGEKAMDKAKEKGIEMRADVDGYIRKNPEKSVLIAAGVGVAVGAMAAAAMMNKKR